jgi:hypothetical protein
MTITVTGFTPQEEGHKNAACLPAAAAVFEGTKKKCCWLVAFPPL